MAQSPIFLRPVFKETVWGGHRLGDAFGYPIPSAHTGECWAISAHPHGESIVVGGVYDGLPLSQLWQEHRSLFGGCDGDRFPLLVKLIDAAADLSIQVHPDDAYAAVHENGALGKTECWYILDCPPDATIVIGHHARDRAELVAMITEGRWREFIREIPIRPGDFFQIEPGCLHAIKAGTLLLETQQNSDITYRVYDYDRLADGRPRQLHLAQSIDVLTAPFAAIPLPQLVTECPGAQCTQLIRCEKYTVERFDTTGPAVLPQHDPFVCVSVIAGQGCIDGYPIEKGAHFILPAGYGDASLEGCLSLILSAPS